MLGKTTGGDSACRQSGPSNEVATTIASVRNVKIGLYCGLAMGLIIHNLVCIRVRDLDDDESGLTLEDVFLDFKKPTRL